MDKKVAIAGAAGITGLIACGYQAYNYYQENNKKKEEEHKQELEKQNKYLSQINAEKRRKLIKGNVNYKLGICAAKGNKYAGFIEITFEMQELGHLFIDFASPTGHIESLSVNGQQVEQVLWNSHFIMLPQSQLKLGNNLVSVLFVNDYVTNGEGFHSFIDTDNKQYIYSHFEPAYCRKWIPCFDQPDIKCTMQLSVLVPSDWKAISNELQIGETSDDLNKYFIQEFEDDRIRHIVNRKLNIENTGDIRIYRFKKTPIMSTYLLHLSVGPYYQIQSDNSYKNIPMSLYCRESLYKDLIKQQQVYFETVSKCMAFYEKFFHYEFPFSKYDHIFCPEYNIGAMENVGAITVNDSYIFRDKVPKSRRAYLLTILTHELCHMWFGDLVTMVWWNDTWLKESFADWLSYYSAQHLSLSFESFNHMADFNDRKAWGYSTDQSNASHPIAGDVVDTQQARSIFDGITYSKGASVLKQLMFVMGYQQFSLAIGHYFQKHQYSNTQLLDFFESMQMYFSNSNFDLNQWKEDWIGTAGCNQLKPVFDREQNRFTIHQTSVIEQFTHFRWHKIKAAFFTQNGSMEVKDLWVENKEYTHFSFPVDQYKAVLINYEDYGFCKVIVDQQSFEYFSNDITQIEGIVNQKILVRALFEMVRDAKLTTQQYLDLIQKNADKDLSEDILAAALSYLTTCIYHYTPSKYHYQLYEQSFNMVSQIIENREINDDLEVMLTGYLIEFAYNDDHVNKLVKKLEDPSSEFQKVNFNYYQKWQIVVNTFKSEFFIKDQTNLKLKEKRLQEDQSDYGKRQELTCNALIAFKNEEKEELWNLFVNPDKNVAAHNVFAQMNGFNTKKQSKLYHDKYFEHLKNVYEQQPITYAQVFLQNLFPISDDFDYLLERIDSIINGLKQDELPTLKKKMIEKKDYVERRQKVFQSYE